MLAGGRRRQMKTIWCLLVCILVSLVVASTVDRLPDPPAANPDLVQFRISSPHELPPTAGRLSVVPIPAFWLFDEQAEFDPSWPVIRLNRIDPLERATDPSPPVIHS
jgi:hypothetical protein